MTPTDGAPIPAVAPAAIQQGRAAARNILRTIRRQSRKPFHYWDKGNLATIGRSRGVAQFGQLYFSGRLAWLLWLFVHIMYLAGFRNRLVVLFEWAYAYLTDQRGARLLGKQSDATYSSGDGSKYRAKKSVSMGTP